MVGQNRIFNALHQFRRSFWDGLSSHDIAGFFVAFGDWGVGKTRLGYEVIAEATGRVDQWLVNRNEYLIRPFDQADTKPTVMEPALREGVLPLYIRYSSVCDDDINGENWVARLSVEAIRHTIQAKPGLAGPSELYEDLLGVLRSKGVNVRALAVVGDRSRSYADRLDAAMKVFRDHGINHLWIVVDEVETPADIKRGLREDTRSEVENCYLKMVTEVIKHEGHRKQHPYVNFLLLCSMGMKDQIEIGPNQRRAHAVVIEPSQLTDVHGYVEHVKECSVDPTAVAYPPGTLEGAFLLANRNLGWFNVIMASVHEAHVGHKARRESVPAWQLLKEFAKTNAQATHIVNHSEVLASLGTVAGVPLLDVERIVYGQLPVPVGSADSAALSEGQANVLLCHESPGRGRSFAEMIRIHIDVPSLEAEIVKPEYAFKSREGQAATYYTENCEISVVGLLKELHAFSVAVGGAMDTTVGFVMYSDKEQWAEQLSSLYPRDGIELVAECLHQIFTKSEYRADEARYVAMSFRLWREFNKLMVSVAESKGFFRDAKHEPRIEEYVATVRQTRAKHGAAVCLGLAKLLDDRLDDAKTKQVPGLRGIPHKVFHSRFGSPAMDGLAVTPDGICAVLYCLDARETIIALQKYIAPPGHVQPILVLFPASVDSTAFEQQLESLPVLRRCTITHRLTGLAERFLLRYSGRGDRYNAHEARLSEVSRRFEGSCREEWQLMTRGLANQLRDEGYLITPIWDRKVSAVDDFAKGYRYMLANDCSLDATNENSGGPLRSVEFENCRLAIKKNTHPPKSWNHGPLLDLITTDGTHRPRVPRCFVALLRELRGQSNVKKLADRFFFLVPEDEMNTIKQLETILEVLIGIGLVRKKGDLYKTVDPHTLQAERESASTWLTGQCRDSINAVGDLLDSQARRLQQNKYPTAKQLLESADTTLNAVRFDYLSETTETRDIDNAATESLRTAVQQVLSIEGTITQVCPLDMGQGNPEFGCSVDRIAWFQSRYKSENLSLWECVAFLAWFKRTAVAAQEQIIGEVDRQISEANQLDVAAGKPFPIAPVTLPLKAIKAEFETAFDGSTRTTMRTRKAPFPVGNYPLMIDQYLVNSEFENAWGRMEALKARIQVDCRDSFFARFKNLHEKWTKVVRDYERAATLWNQYVAFTADAPSDIQRDVHSLRLEIQKYQSLVEGGLKLQIQAECDQNEAGLMDSLQAEVEAASQAIQKLPSTIRDHLDQLKTSLKATLRQRDLRALNRIRRALGRAVLDEPTPAETYGATKAKYEAFHEDVIREGAACFTQPGKWIDFGVCVDILCDIEANTYDEDEHPDHADAIGELKRMRIIRSKLELR